MCEGASKQTLDQKLYRAGTAPPVLKFLDPPLRITSFSCFNFQDFQQNNYQFTEQLCLADSDGDGIPNGLELGLNTTRHNLQTLCQFIGSNPFNNQLVQFLERSYLLANPIGHPGKKKNNVHEI